MTIKQVTYITHGFDPGLRHGAIVRSVFAFTPRKHWLLDIQVEYSWTVKNDRLAAKSSQLEISRFVESQLASKFSKPSQGVGIEFSANSVYWRAQKSQVVSLAFMLGYLTSSLFRQGLMVSFITVDQLKKAFSIQPKEKKQEYMAKEIQLLDAPEFDPRSFTDVLMQSDDVYDAFLLSYLTAYLIDRKSGQ
jgi:hypothetical protein